MIDSYAAFIMMYYILDAAADELEGERILNYATTANPFIFKDKGSADPAVYGTFKKAWDRKFEAPQDVDPEDCKIFIRDYMESLSEECLDTFNLVVNEGTWTEDLREVEKQAQERRDYIAGM